jgi:hypothetical protein
MKKVSTAAVKQKQECFRAEADDRFRSGRSMGKETPLTDTQRQKLSEQEGQQLYKILSKIVPGKGWQILSDDSKRKQIAKLRKEIEEERPQRIARLAR